MAADLPSRKGPPGDPPLPVFTWTGFYIGFNYGYAWKGHSAISTAAAPLFDTNLLPIWGAASALGASGSANSRLNGFFGGAQLGYNWQFANSLVAGLEADIQAGGISGGGWFGGVTPAALPGSIASTSVSLHRSLEHFGTVRGRLGYAVKPGMLAYVTGGLAFGGFATKVSLNQSLGPSLMAAATPKADHLTLCSLGIHQTARVRGYFLAVAERKEAQVVQARTKHSARNRLKGCRSAWAERQWRTI